MRARTRWYFRSARLWRWTRITAVLGVVIWLLFQVASEGGSRSATTTRTAATSAQTDVCRAHGWKRFRPTSPDKPRKVYDLVMINTELDWLEIRLNTTFDAVDYFVLVEGAKTFTGLDKPLTLKANLPKFAAYQSKIIYHEIEYPPDFNPERTWDREDLQRNAMFTQVFPRLAGARAPNPGDAIVVSDVDEIPRPSTLRLLRACAFPRRLTLRSRFYYYSFQWLHRGAEWPHPQATYYRGPRGTLLPNALRIGDGGVWPFREWEKGDLRNASWHCSSCFATMGELLTKMASFSHRSMNAEPFRDRRRIADRVRSGRDLWDREGEVFDRVEDNRDVPSFLLDNKERFGYLLNRDGPSAGFTDYRE
ncbi:hypothetical protein VTK56DRAFT_8004 [Thermocarpiscus australiensis]